MSAELELGSRQIPVPHYVSDEAKEFIATPRQTLLGSFPPLDDKEAWRTHIAQVNERMLAGERMMLPHLDVQVERTVLNGVRVAWVRPRTTAPENEGRVLMNMHGGAHVYGEGTMQEALVTAHVGKIEVLSVDYRVPPDFPYPANLEDTIAAYRALLESHGAENICLFGTSAGGHIAVTTILKARDLGLPLPAAAGIATPSLELSSRRGYSGDSLYTKDGLCILSGTGGGAPGKGPVALFLGDADPTDPLVSPIYADFTKGFSPSYLLTGTRDMMLSATVLMHRKLHRAGVKTELHVFEAMHHGFQTNITLPEAREALLDMTRFFREQMDAARAGKPGGQS